MSDEPRLLVVDDDAELSELLQTYLTRQGFTVACAGDGVAMDKVLAAQSIDLLILDLMLPGEDGLSIARRIKNDRPDLPIVMLSAQGDEVDRIVGLEVGADDYLAKPFNPRELLARVRAVLRRGRRNDEPAQVEEAAARVVAFGAFRLDLDRMTLYRGTEPVALTSGELDLLVVLVQNPNRVLDRDRILDLLTGAERSPFDRSIDVRVTRLRSKIEDNPSQPRFIRTVWGKGYRFCPLGGD